MTNVAGGIDLATAEITSWTAVAPMQHIKELRQQMEREKIKG